DFYVSDYLQVINLIDNFDSLHSKMNYIKENIEYGKLHNFGNYQKEYKQLVKDTEHLAAAINLLRDMENHIISSEKNNFQYGGIINGFNSSKDMILTSSYRNKINKEKNYLEEDIETNNLETDEQITELDKD